MPSQVIHDSYQVDPLDEVYLTAEEVADILRLTVKRLHELVREGHGPPYVQSTPQRRLFPRSGLKAFITARHSEVSSP